MKPISMICASIILASGISIQSASKSTGKPDVLPALNPQYFPLGVFARRLNDSNSLAQTYAARLRELGEPSLLDAAKSKLNTEYRVLFVAGFCASVIRLTLETEGDGQLRALSTVHTDINGRCALESPRSSDILREQLTGF
jgi:hypothetical protein